MPKVIHVTDLSLRVDVADFGKRMPPTAASMSPAMTAEAVSAMRIIPATVLSIKCPGLLVFGS